MSDGMSHDLPDHLAEVADTLRRYGPHADSLQLDQIKHDALARARRPKGPFMRSKIVTVSLAGALALTGGTAGVLAAKPSGGQSAAKSQYVPGKGCGLTNPGDDKGKPCPPAAGKKK